MSSTTPAFLLLTFLAALPPAYGHMRSGVTSVDVGSLMSATALEYTVPYLSNPMTVDARDDD